MSKGKGVVVTRMLGHESQDTLHRGLAKQYKAGYTVVNMYPRDTQEGLIRRLRNTFNERRESAVSDASKRHRAQMEQHRPVIEQVDFTDEALQEIGKITAFRPWEVQSFLSGFFKVQSGDRLSFTPSDVRKFFDDEEVFLGSEYFIEKIAREYTHGGHLGTLRVIDAVRYTNDTLEQVWSRNQEYIALSRVALGLPLNTLHGVQVLHRFLDTTGLGYVEGDKDGFRIRGEWLKRDWERHFKENLTAGFSTSME